MQRGMRVETLRDAEYEAPSSAIAFDYSSYDSIMESIYGYDHLGYQQWSGPTSQPYYPRFLIEYASPELSTTGITTNNRMIL